MDDQVLTQDHCDALNQCLRENSRCSEIIGRLKAAGLPVDQWEEDCAAKRRIAEGLKREFFRGQP